jgi:hypothetical protein
MNIECGNAYARMLEPRVRQLLGYVSIHGGNAGQSDFDPGTRAA